MVVRATDSSRCAVVVGFAACSDDDASVDNHVGADCRSHRFPRSDWIESVDELDEIDALPYVESVEDVSQMVAHGLRSHAELLGHRVYTEPPGC